MGMVSDRNRDWAVRQLAIDLLNQSQMSSFKDWTPEALERIQSGQVFKTVAERREARLLAKAVKCLKPDNSVPVIPETRIQQQVIKEFAVRWPKVYRSGALFSVPNQGKRSRGNSMRMKAEGLFSGVSDLLLLWPSGPFHGACVELKTTGGKLSWEQNAWMAERETSGYAIAVCWSVDEAISFFDNYLNGRHE